MFEYGFNEFRLVNLVASIDDDSVSRQISDQLGEAVLDDYKVDQFVQYLTLPETTKLSDIEQTIDLVPGEGALRTGSISFGLNGKTYCTLGIKANVILPVAIADPAESSISVVSVDGRDLPSGLRGTLVKSFLNTDAWLIVIALGFFIVIILLTAIVITYSKERRRVREVERRRRMMR